MKGRRRAPVVIGYAAIGLLLTLALLAYDGGWAWRGALAAATRTFGLPGGAGGGLDRAATGAATRVEDLSLVGYVKPLRARWGERVVFTALAPSLAEKLEIQLPGQGWVPLVPRGAVTASGDLHTWELEYYALFDPGSYILTLRAAWPRGKKDTAVILLVEE